MALLRNREVPSGWLVEGELAPVVTGRQYIVAKTAHPNAIFVQVPLRHDMIVPLYIAPYPAPRLRNKKKPSYPNGVDVRANLVPGERAKPRADCSTRLLKPVLFVQQKAGVRKVTKKDADYERLAGQLAEKEVPEKNDDLAVGTRARIRKHLKPECPLAVAGLGGAVQLQPPGQAAAVCVGDPAESRVLSVQGV